MKEYKNIRSIIKPQPIVIDEYSVWVNTDIEEIEITDEQGISIEYEFNQAQYTKDEFILKTHADMEYIAMMSEVDFDE